MLSKLCVLLLLFSVCVVILVYMFINQLDDAEIIYKTVETKNGAVRGLLKKTLFKQTEYYSFRGIPFAKPPIGELRFKRPEPVESWKPNVLDAFDYAPSCSQIYPKLNTRSSEDCLFLNVFVPAVNRTDKLPVMIFIHGGGFVGGNGDDMVHGPDFLVERDIILVTSNHRLSAFGFISLGTPEYSGNMGLKDQQLALKWTYENIEHFGGDKAKITLGGHSSGSISVTHHMLNEESRRYFQQSIAMSGAALNPVEFAKGDFRCVITKVAKKYLNQSVEHVNEMIAFLNNATKEEIIHFSVDIKNQDPGNINNIFLPIIEDKHAIQPFMTEDPITKFDKIKSMNITSYFTFTNREILADKTYLNPGFMYAFLSDFYVDLPIYRYIPKKKYLKDLMKDLRNYYFSNAKTDFDRIDQRIILESDLKFIYFIEKWVRQQAAITQKDLFLHEFSVDTILKLNEKSVQMPGASHGDDLCFIFLCGKRIDVYEQILETKDTDSESALAWRSIDTMTTLFSNFIKYGKPSIEENPNSGFNPIKNKKMNFLNITNDGLVLEKSPNDRKMKFLDNLFSKAKRLLKEHDDVPKQTLIEQFCDKFV